MEQKAKHLIHKFILNECSPEEIEYLVDYFQNKDLNRDFPEVEEVLALIDEKPELSEKDQERIYNDILEQIRVKHLSLRTKKRKKRQKYLALAAVFIGIIGVVFYVNIIGDKEGQKEPSVGHNEKESVVELEMEDG